MSIGTVMGEVLGEIKAEKEAAKEARKRNGKGWKESPDASGKAPKHKAAASKKKLSTTARAPMQPEKQITVYWWNMGRKTQDFKGSYSDFMKTKGITKKVITHPTHKDIKGLRFKVSTGSTTSTIDTYDTNYYSNCDIAIQAFLTMLGDKTLFINGYGREYRLNW